jgi:hypothetical protein
MSLTSPRVLLPAGVLLALAAAVATPSSALLPAPESPFEILVAATALALVFVSAWARPVAGLYALVALVVLEGAIRKWVVNDVTVFLLKDFVAFGLYAAVLPRLSRAELRRPRWLLLPLAGLLVLALLHVPLADSLSQAAVGLRSWVVYVPLLWTAPALVTSRARALGLVGAIAGLGVVNAVLAVIQARSGPGVLNELVSGATAPLITVGGEAYIRPSGTFMQVGVLAAYLFLAVLAAFALVLEARRRRWWLAALGASALLSWGVVYSSARSLLGGVLLAFALLAVGAVVRRRVAAPAAVAVAVAIGLLTLFQGVPWAQARGTDAIEWLRWHDWERVTILRPGATPLSVRVPPELAEGLLERIRSVRKPFDIPALTDGDVRVTITIAPPPRSAEGAATVTVATPPPDGGPRGEAPAGGFLGRAADFDKAGDEKGLWSGRVRPQLELIAHQRLVGHGTGTMTLGSGYADGGMTILYGESMYSKAAWELGLPGVVLFVWFVGALAVASVRGYRAARADWQRVLAAIAVGACAILPIWYLFTFALDFPVVGILLYALVGCASVYAFTPAAAAPGQSERGA